MTTNQRIDQESARAVAEQIKGMFDSPEIHSADAIEFTRAIETLYMQGADEFGLEAFPQAILGVYEHLEEMEVMRACGSCFQFILNVDRDCGIAFDKTTVHCFVGMKEAN